MTLYLIDMMLSVVVVSTLRTLLFGCGCRMINPLNTKRRLLYLKTQFVAQKLLSPLNTKRRLLYLKTQFVAQ